MFGREAGVDETSCSIFLRLAVELDDTVHDVVRHIIVTATREAADDEDTWLKLSAHLSDDDHGQLVRLVSRLHRPTTADEGAENRRAESIAALRRAEERLAENSSRT